MITSVHLEGIYAGQGYEMPHHLLTDVVRYVRVYDSVQKKYVTVKVPYKDPDNPHCWINAEYGNFPDGIKHGARVRFWASYFPRKGGQRLTEVREVEIIEESRE